MKIYLLFLVLSVSFYTHAQDPSRKFDVYNYVYTQNGYIIDTDGNKLQGLIKEKTFSLVLTLPSGEKKKYSAATVKEYALSRKGNETIQDRFISTGTSFLLLVYELKNISIYKTTKTTTTMPTATTVGSTSSQDVYYIRRKTETSFTTVKKSNSLSKYFADCPYLSEQIKDKKFEMTRQDLQTIAAIYDRECAPTNP